MFIGSGLGRDDAYLDDKEQRDGMPFYSINFRLYRNGINPDLTMYYGDCSMRRKLGMLVSITQDK